MPSRFTLIAAAALLAVPVVASGAAAQSTPAPPAGTSTARASRPATTRKPKEAPPGMRDDPPAAGQREAAAEAQEKPDRPDGVPDWMREDPPAAGRREAAAEAQEEPDRPDGVPDWMREDPAGEAGGRPSREPRRVEEPDFFERWIRLGKLRIRERVEWQSRRFRSRGLESFGVEVVERGVERDQELRNLLEIETFGIGHERLNTYLHVEFRGDVDGTQQPSFHKNIVTSFDPNRMYRVNAAWAEADEVAGHLRIRVGRQSALETDPVLFDGIHVTASRFRVLKVPSEVRLFAGVMASPFSNLRQDLVTGGGLRVRPARNLAFEVRNLNYQRSRFEGEVRYEPARDWTLLGVYGLYGSGGRDARAEARWLPFGGLEITAGVYERYAHDDRLDHLTEQSTVDYYDRLLLPRLAAFREFYLRVTHDATAWMSWGGEFLRHRLRTGSDETPFDTDFRQTSVFVDLRGGPLRFRSEVRYHDADRDPSTYIVPRLPQPSEIRPVVVGETDHLEWHLNGSADFRLLHRDWNLYGGVVFHRLNYTDALSSTDHEKSIDYRVELTGRITPRVTLKVRYDLTREMRYFVPYFDRMQVLSVNLDIRL